jgi:hypothetical protein
MEAERMVGALPGARNRLPLLLAAVLLGSGCNNMVPRSRLAECQQVSQTLRTENARLKDRVLAFENQNRDYAERAVDDARRLAVQSETIDRLEDSIRRYQTERAQLESAFEQLTANLGDDAMAATRRQGWPGARTKLDNVTSPDGRQRSVRGTGGRVSSASAPGQGDADRSR